MFEVQFEDEKSEARGGTFTLNNRKFETPGFLPVATKADVKLISPDELHEMGASGVITNALVLFFRPGLEIIEEADGIHNFMRFDGIIFSDSGGFQMLNPDFLVKVNDSFVTFKSPFTGSKLEFSPQRCAEIQMRLGSDVAMTLDDCPSYGGSHDEISVSNNRTIKWADDFIKAHDRDTQNVFGIIQGGVFQDLREKCAQSLTEMDFDGFGIGGLCIGEPKELMHEVIQWTTQLLPKEKPRYLMGVGSPEDMLEAISNGVDIFDSVFPTRNARHNTVYTRKGKINLGKEKYRSELGPIDEGCGCYTCRKFSLSYVNHLLREYEYFGMRLASIHNLYFLVNLMREARKAIRAEEFLDFKKDFEKNYLGN
jgi:queuine tRNA-ribosyltransferase